MTCCGLVYNHCSANPIDFLASKPVSRSDVITAKLSASLVSVLATGIAFALAGYVAALGAAEESFSARTFFLLAAILLLVQVFFWALGALFAVVIPRIKTVIAVTLPTVFAFYIVGTLGGLLENDGVRWLTPFKFFDPIYIIQKGAFEPKYLIFEAVLVALLIAATYVVFAKKNIRAAA
ncbi:hypothetical protein EG829_15420 [bacterium]|nr:hypothetical protein [bacterium]